MFEYEEIIALAMSMFVMAFILVRLKELRRINGWKWLAGSFSCLFTGLVLTVVEGWRPLGGLTHNIEHLCYTTSVGMLAFWVWRYLTREEAGT